MEALYSFEAFLMKKFHTLNGICSNLVPQGPSYENVMLSNQVCTTVGSLQVFVNGNHFGELAYGFSYSNTWRNFGLIVTFTFVFIIALLRITQFNTSMAVRDAVTKFKRVSTFSGQCSYALPLTVVQTLFILSVTLSSPLLALNTLLGSPLPIPVGLFDIRGPNESSPAFIPGSLPPHKFSHKYKRSTSASVTVVEGCRSSDVWLSKGNAVDGKGKFGTDEPEMPPLPFQNDDSHPVHVHGTPHSELSAQFGRIRNGLRAGSHNSGGDESVAFATRIMIAQRHHSTLAQTVVVPSGVATTTNHDLAAANALLSMATGVTKSKRTSHLSHLRTCSVSSIPGPAMPKSQDGFSISPPPSFPLPPTPPNVEAARLAMLSHKKSFSSGFSFGAVDDINKIDALTAGVLPVLVPGVTVGDGDALDKAY